MFMSMGGGLRSSQSTGHSSLTYLLHHSILPYFFSLTSTPALLVSDLFFTLHPPNRMVKHLKRAESRKSHSWFWDSHSSPTTSKWLPENLDKVEQSVKRMLMLIEEDGDSFAKKAQMYYQKRPELKSLVGELRGMYLSLANRYAHLTRELRKKVSSNHQSQTSSISESAASELTSASGSPPPPLGLPAGSGSFDVYQKEAGEPSSFFDSETLESELDDSSITNHTDDLVAKVAAYEKELQITSERMQVSQVEMTSLLMLEVQNHKSLEGAVPGSSEGNVAKIQEAMFEAEITKYLEERTGLKEQLREHKSRCESLIGGNTIIRLEKADCESKIMQLKEEIRRLEGSLETLKSEKDALQKETDAVRVELSYRDAQVETLEGHLHQLHMEHAVAIANGERANGVVAELEDEIARKKKVIADCWEEKREAIRQLCFSMEHYRSTYHRLRQALRTGNRLAMVAAI